MDVKQKSDVFEEEAFEAFIEYAINEQLLRVMI